METVYKYNVTFHGLQHWYTTMFEKLGWMLLAERDGRGHKIVSYKQGLADLLEAIEEKITYTHDADKLQDLKFLRKNVTTLCDHVNKEFKIEKKPSRGNSQKSKRSSSSSKRH
jgi:hypothetical protein